MTYVTMPERYHQNTWTLIITSYVLHILVLPSLHCNICKNRQYTDDAAQFVFG